MNEIICTMTGTRLRQVLLNGQERQRLMQALQELNVGQTELAEMYAAREGQTEGEFAFEQRDGAIVLVRIEEKPAER